jgi:plastocyanin
MDNFRYRRLAFVAAFSLLAPAFALSGSGESLAQTGSRQFPETGRTVKARFLEYWTQNGGLAQQGFPISDEMSEVSDTDGKTYTVQYFERAVFEMHPENRRPFDVLLSLLGNNSYKQKYPQGAPNQKASTTNARRFTETGRTLGGKFREYWEKNGGLAQQGFPISDEFQEKNDLDGKTYTVQYFERAVFELHPENKAPYDVLLSQLGKFRYDQKYAAKAEVKIDIVDFKFKPDPVTVKAGTRVTWTQRDKAPHNAVAKNKSFESPIMDAGESWSYVFTKPGVYDYWCTLHPEMLGKLTVE